MTHPLLATYASEGYTMNLRACVYKNGTNATVEKIATIVTAYEEIKLQTPGREPSVNETAVEAKVSWNLAQKVITGYETGTLELINTQDDNRPVGVGSKIFGEGLTVDQEVYLLWL